MRVRPLAWLLCGTLLVVSARPSSAKKPAPAKVETADDTVVRLGEDAVKAYKEARYDAAISLLTRAYAIRPVAGLLYNLAKAYDKQGDVIKAYETYKKYLDEAPGQPEDQRDPKLEAKAQEKLAVLEIAYKEKTAAEKRPDITQPKGPSPEELALRAEADRKLRAAEAAKEELEVGRQRRHARNLYLGVGLAALGVVGFGAGIGLYSAASSKHSEFAASHVEDDKRTLAASGQSLATASTAFYIVGLVFVAGSGYFWYSWLAKDKEPGAPPPRPVSFMPSLVPVVSPAGVGGVATWRF